MLYQYTPAANRNNWLHDCLCQIVQAIHADIGANRTPPSWPNIVPTLYRTQLKPHKKALTDRLDEYIKVLKGLADAERLLVITALSEQNAISALLDSSQECSVLNDLPQAIHSAIRELFYLCFKLLTKLKIRDEQYKIIYRNAPYKVCAFCGCEHFNAPTGPREDLDHYLAESIYPFAAANLHNLAPTCGKCNSQYKLAKDVLRTKDGVRRKAFNPFDCTAVTISLRNSVLNPTPVGALFSDWRIDFSIQSEEVDTWEELYSIRERYKRDFLVEHFNTWLQEFMDYCKALREKNLVDRNNPNLVLLLVESYSENLYDDGLADMSFLKCAVFKLILSFYNTGNNRIISLMDDLYAGNINPHEVFA